MSELESMSVELRHLLDRAEKWLHMGLAFELDTGAGQIEQTEYVETALRAISEMKARTASSLLNVAFLGGFSSGKSFLISGLQKCLEYAPIPEAGGMISDQYIGLLHSAAKASTACPATVVPVEEDGEKFSHRGFMQVRFEGESNWEEIGNSPSPGTVAAYTTQDPRVIADWRPPRHRQLRVAEVEILLGSACLPAKLYDLPGHGALNPEHERIANAAWATADCFVYTIQATHTLSPVDMELIRRLYHHHLDSGKPVIWVMSGIDRAAMMNVYKKAEWKDAIETNNAFLRNEFPLKPGQADTFIGVDGFIPVSPAWEALSRWHEKQGERNASISRESMSRMDKLRKALTDIIEAGAGRQHLTSMARETRTHVLRRHQALTTLLASAQTPLNELSDRKNDLSRRLTQLRVAMAVVRTHLETSLEGHARRVDRSFEGLEAYLHHELDAEIRSADLTKEKEAIKIETRKEKLLREWANDRGPRTIWEDEYKDFMNSALSLVRETISETSSPEGLATATSKVDLQQLTIPPSQRYRTSAQDLVQTISGIVGVSTPVLTAIATAAGLVGSPALIVSGGVAVLAGIMYGTIRRNKSKSTALDHLRKEWIENLDKTAEHYRGAYAYAVGGRGTLIIDRVDELLSERRDELSREIILIEHRLAEPQNADRSDLVSRLDPHCQAGEKVLAALKEFI
ncbi:GTPase domain-containing protein [Streptosporangium sp. 'caverna']|uniref:GTPase domain-containing protein n=1 Tax=Streptosporangium sp. 'caverna' TaxID=2202249 RepID=UPI0013A6A740|nr:GTPase domain-containing protein [Streptosporangium sp. 'caverna']